MTVENRAFALDAATKLNLGEAAATVKAAEAYFAFLTSAATPTPAGKPAAAVAAKPAVKPAAAAAKKPTKSEEEIVKAALEAQRAEQEAADGEEGAEGEEAEAGSEDEDALPASAEGVSAGIARLLKANKRKDAIGLLKKFGASSSSGVKPKDFAKFVAEVTKLLPVEGAASDEGDLTA